jgi:hypothetical protein
MENRCYYCGKPISEGVICHSRKCIRNYAADDLKAEREFNSREHILTVCSICDTEFLAESKHVRFCGACRYELERGAIEVPADTYNVDRILMN